MRSCLVLVIVASMVSVASAEPRDAPTKDGETAAYWSLGVTALGLSTSFYASRASRGSNSTAIDVVGFAGLTAFVVGPSWLSWFGQRHSSGSGQQHERSISTVRSCATGTATAITSATTKP